MLADAASGRIGGGGPAGVGVNDDDDARGADWWNVGHTYPVPMKDRSALLEDAAACDALLDACLERLARDDAANPTATATAAASSSGKTASRGKGKGKNKDI